MEKDNYSKALKEVYIVLQNSEKEIQDSIPEKFKQFITNNMEMEYTPTIDFNNPNWDDSVMEETQAILAVLYRDYIVSEEEREKLLKEEATEEEKNEQELKDKYNPDNLFKNKEKTIETTDNSIDIAKYKESIFIKIKNWFKRIF